jgi:hypothetical protein
VVGASRLRATRGRPSFAFDALHTMRSRTGQLHVFTHLEYDERSEDERS